MPWFLGTAFNQKPPSKAFRIETPGRLVFTTLQETLPSQKPGVPPPNGRRSEEAEDHESSDKRKPQQDTLNLSNQKVGRKNKQKNKTNFSFSQITKKNQIPKKNPPHHHLTTAPLENVHSRSSRNLGIGQKSKDVFLKTSASRGFKGKN